ncbi:hypothetical protein PVAP13_9NG666500 [Panicum virgatum]|uniref:Uncharacterized protein n=1 Tax=Panicum virgatum TaxID=38727 RepID=A0A8T0MZ15_PANVG|nr:hypothetical protein PVAP13_9NG666500 [Panicum virgatum]
MQTEVQADGGGCFRSTASPGRVVVSSCRSVTWRRASRKAARDTATRWSRVKRPSVCVRTSRPMLVSELEPTLFTPRTLTWKTCRLVEACHLDSGAGAFPSWRNGDKMRWNELGAVWIITTSMEGAFCTAGSTEHFCS